MFACHGNPQSLTEAGAVVGLMRAAPAPVIVLVMMMVIWVLMYLLGVWIDVAPITALLRITPRDVCVRRPLRVSNPRQFPLAAAPFPFSQLQQRHPGIPESRG